MLKSKFLKKNFKEQLSPMDLKSILLENNIKPTIQRIQILEFLIKNKIHPSVDDIYVALEGKIPTLSRTTVYNTLNIFKEVNLVQFLTFEENEIRFDVDLRPHAHLKCNVCDKVYDLNIETSMDFNGNIIEGHLVNETYIFFKGVCKDCLKKEHN